MGGSPVTGVSVVVRVREIPNERAQANPVSSLYDAGAGAWSWSWSSQTDENGEFLIEIPRTFHSHLDNCMKKGRLQALMLTNAAYSEGADHILHQPRTGFSSNIQMLTLTGQPTHG